MKSKEFILFQTVLGAEDILSSSDGEKSQRRGESDSEGESSDVSSFSTSLVLLSPHRMW